MSPSYLFSADTILLGFTTDNQPRILENAALVIKDGQIHDHGTQAAMRRKYPLLSEQGGRGKAVIPGLINAHHHVGVTPFQMGARDLPLELWFGERLRMRDVPPDLDTLYAGFEMVASGVTTVQHLHSRAPGDMDAVLARANTIIGAYLRLGMRVSYSFAMRDQNRVLYAADEEFVSRLSTHLRPVAARYLAGFGLTLEQQVAVFHALRAAHAGNDKVAIQIAPANLHWLSDAALEAAATLHDATGAPMHMHLLETPYQRDYATTRGQGSAVEQIARFGILKPGLTIGHAVWMTPDDLAQCKEAGVCLCHNCSSNFRLKSGTADLNAFLASGMPVALGIDEAGLNDDRDMLQEMRLALTVHRPAGHDAPAPTADQILRMATEHGAATTAFAERIGRLDIGRGADFVVLDWDRLTYPWQDARSPFVDTLVRRAKPSAVSQVTINGDIVYTEGQFRNLDAQKTLHQLHQLQQRPLSSAEIEMDALADAAVAVSRAYYRDAREPR